MGKYKVIYKAFPDALRGVVRGLTSFRGDLYIILIDACLSDSEREKTLKHELSHILLGHFIDDQKSVEEMEREADQHADMMTENEFNMLRGYAI